MKKRINIFSNDIIKSFLSTLFSNYELMFIKLEDIDYNVQNTQANIIFISSDEELDLINFKNLSDNYLIITNLEKNEINFNDNQKLMKTPVSINKIKSGIENFLQNSKLQFCDISIDNEKLTNLKNNSFCYLTKIELEILSYLIREKKTSKNFIKENILNIKSNIETNSLESHLTRIRKKMQKINTIVKIQTKSEKLLITF
tara:strand:- start:1546 stop:2148 length:603 start_codon:yes stop_codon:yes gene_type:complete